MPTTTLASRPAPATAGTEPLVALTHRWAAHQVPAAWAHTVVLATALLLAAALVTLVGQVLLAAVLVALALLRIGSCLLWTGTPRRKVAAVARAVAEGRSCHPAHVVSHLGSWAVLRAADGQHRLVWCAGVVLPLPPQDVGWCRVGPTTAVVMVAGSTRLVTSRPLLDPLATLLARPTTRRSP